MSLSAPSCAEHGYGGLSWLLRVDRVAHSLKTGGAPLSGDPFGVGYCFDTLAETLPQTTAITFNGDSFDAAPIASLGLPIYTRASPSVLFLRLPIRQLALSGVKISSGGDCIGGFNASVLDEKCDENSDCPKWRTDGSFTGFITLEDADATQFANFGNQSLCVILTAAARLAPDGRHCVRDAAGAIADKGDYCSTTQTPGGCADSFLTAATFAASAVKICP